MWHPTKWCAHGRREEEEEEEEEEERAMPIHHALTLRDLHSSDAATPYDQRQQSRFARKPATPAALGAPAE
jgi:hypothetical protein